MDVIAKYDDGVTLCLQPRYPFFRVLKKVHIENAFVIGNILCMFELFFVGIGVYYGSIMVPYHAKL